MVRKLAVVGAVVLGLVATVGPAPEAGAGGGGVPVYSVATTVDEVNFRDDVRTLREAVIEANTDGIAGAAISVPPGVYPLTLCGVEEEPGGAGDLDLIVAEHVQITGAGDQAVIQQTCPGQRVLQQTGASASLELARVTISGGNVVDDTGGGLRVAGDLTLALGSALLANTAGQSGGGAFVVGEATITQSTVNSNSAGGVGGGVWATTVTLIQSTVAGNSSVLGGGGVFASDQATVQQSTVAQNRSVDFGGGIGTSGEVILNTSTLLANRAVAGANVAAAEDLVMTASIVALGSQGEDCEVLGAVLGAGFNVGFDESCGPGMMGDVVGLHPMLAPFGPPGAFTAQRQTVAPSPAVDLNPIPCMGETADQVGNLRPVGPRCDSGAVELAPAACVQSFSDVTVSHPFFADICWLDQMGITGGFGGGTFRPAQSITRQSMAAFIFRLAGSPLFPVPTTDPFDDVPTTHRFATEIAWMAEEDIAGGFPDGSYRPGNVVTRQAMAAFLHRVLGEPEVAPQLEPTFTDVPFGHTFSTAIEYLAAHGVAGGFPDGTYGPSKPVTRQAMAAFLLRMTTTEVLAGI